MESAAARLAVVSAVSMILGIGLCTATLITDAKGGTPRAELTAGGVGAGLLLAVGIVGLVVSAVLAIVASFRRPALPMRPPEFGGYVPPPPPRAVPPPPVPGTDQGDDQP